MDAVDAIIVENVHFSYGESPVLKGVSLRVRKGEVLAIMGENGAGKTTLIKHFNGLLKPQKGRVLVFGIDTRKASVAMLAKRVGIVFQNPDHQLFSETVEEEVLFTLRNMGYRGEELATRCNYVLEMFDLTKYRRRSPYSLSVGERKRLSIAAMISYEPDVIVLDEPTAGQDFINKVKISRLIKFLKSRGKTVVIVTHDVEFVTQVADRVALMSSGRVVRVGAVRDVLTDERVLALARLIPPQIPRTASILSRNGIPLRRKPLLPGELYIALLEALASKAEVRE